MDTTVRLSGELDPWPTKGRLAQILRAAGLAVVVGHFSIRVKDCQCFIFQQYGDDLGEPDIDAAASTLADMLRDGRLVSDALAKAGVTHRFEIHNAGNEQVGYLHHDWPDAGPRPVW